MEDYKYTPYYYKVTRSFNITNNNNFYFFNKGDYILLNLKEEKENPKDNIYCVYYCNNNSTHLSVDLSREIITPYIDLYKAYSSCRCTECGKRLLWFEDEHIVNRKTIYKNEEIEMNIIAKGHLHCMNNVRKNKSYNNTYLIIDK